MASTPLSQSGSSAPGGLAFDLERLQQQLLPLDLSAPRPYGDAELAYFHFYGLDEVRRLPGVQHFFGHFPSGKHEIVCHYFALAGARGTCFLLHGYFDHAGLYRHLIAYCLSRGFSVVIYDLPGHGLSSGERASIGSFDEYEEVLNACLARFADHAPRPWHAIAQSTGCAVLMDHLLLQKASGFERVVLLAPLVRAAEWRWVKIAHWLGHRFLEKVPRRFGVNSGDAEFLRFLAECDPLQVRHIAVRWVDAMIRRERRFEHLPPSDQPLLIVQGQRDTTVDWRHNIPVIREKFPKSKVLPLQDAYHHLVNETPALREKMFTAIDLYFSEAPAQTGSP
jgi:alpha-beta hydrolase superfamily lysophospholipase